MISSELSSIQEILANSNYRHDISNEFSNWMKYKHYPIVSWTHENRSYGQLSENFTTSYDEWWMRLKLIFTTVSFGNVYFRQFYVLSSQNPSDKLPVQDDWIMIDIWPAGKYVSQLFIFIFIHIYIYYFSCNYISAIFFGIFEYLLLFSWSFL